MLLAGDEFRRTQKGNNNAYCQDNEISWVNWDLLEENNDLFRFTREIIKFRKRYPILRKKRYFIGKKVEGFNAHDITWHGVETGNPDWSKSSNSIAVLLNGEFIIDEEGNRNPDIYIIFNASKINRYYEIPDSPSGMNWKISVDTSNSSPDDIYEPGDEPLVEDKRYYVKKLSLVVFVTGPSH